jgi:hypothetical protein
MKENESFSIPEVYEVSYHRQMENENKDWPSDVSG